MTGEVLRPRVRRWVELPHNSFQAFLNRNGCGLISTSAPEVVRTQYKFDPPALLASIIAWRGTLHVFTSRDIELRARHDEAMKSALCGMNIPNALSQMKDESFDGHSLKIVNDYSDRGRTVWWVT
jgi:hypothetical protein